MKSNHLNRVKEFKEYRIAPLRSLHFKIILPSILTFHSALVSRQSIRADSKAFTKIIRNLWALLEMVEDGYPDPRVLKLQVYLSAESSDKYHDRYSTSRMTWIWAI